jgi:hypothetical protein
LPDGSAALERPGAGFAAWDSESEADRETASGRWTNSEGSTVLSAGRRTFHGVSSAASAAPQPNQAASNAAMIMNFKSGLRIPFPEQFLWFSLF